MKPTDSPKVGPVDKLRRSVATVGRYVGPYSLMATAALAAWQEQSNDDIERTSGWRSFGSAQGYSTYGVVSAHTNNDGSSDGGDKDVTGVFMSFNSSSGIVNFVDDSCTGCDEADIVESAGQANNEVEGDAFTYRTSDQEFWKSSYVWKP